MCIFKKRNNKVFIVGDTTKELWRHKMHNMETRVESPWFFDCYGDDRMLDSRFKAVSPRTVVATVGDRGVQALGEGDDGMRHRLCALSVPRGRDEPSPAPPRPMVVQARDIGGRAMNGIKPSSGFQKSLSDTPVSRWIESVSRQGGVCQSYMRKIAAASNKTEMFRVLCDVNAGAWLFDLHANGVPLPIEQFMKEYAAYVNGGKTVEYPSGYTSKFYCKYADKDSEIEADTTLVYMLDCKARVYVPMNRYPTLILSHGTDATVKMGAGSRLNIELYGDAKYTLADGDKSKVRIMQH